LDKTNVTIRGRWYWAVLSLLAVASSLPLIPVFPIGDVLASSLKISSDGFDWIIEGRALLAGVSDTWPVLRNTNFVLLSALDSVLGQTGIVFAAANSLGLFMQGLALFITLGVARHGHRVSFFVILGYYLMPLHFLSLFVIAETIAVGTLMLSAAFFVKYFESPRLHFAVAGAALSLISGLFQTYGLATILVFAAVSAFRAIRFRQSPRVNLYVASLVLGCLSVFFVVRSAWLSLIPHDSVPSQVELLKLSLDMVVFYSNLWPFLFTPLFLTVFVAFLRPRYRRSLVARRPLSRPSIQFVLALGMGLLLLTFLYQWPESRFSYTYVGALTMFAVHLFAVEAEAIPQEKKEKSTLPIRLFAASSIVIFSLYAPTDVWKPKIGEFSTFGIWPLLLAHSPQYVWYLELREATCKAGAALKSRDEISTLFDDKGIEDPYTRNIGIFALSNCL
jgi:hypothetical protein